MQQAFKR